MTSAFNPNAFFGGFDPRLIGLIHVKDAHQPVDPDLYAFIEASLVRGDYRWNPDHIAFALYQGAYTHETVHLLQWASCPSMMPLLAARNTINIFGAMAIGDFCTVVTTEFGRTKEDPKHLFPIPMMKWLTSSQERRASLIAEAREELAFFDPDHYVSSLFFDLLADMPVVSIKSLGIDWVCAGEGAVNPWLHVGNQYWITRHLIEETGVFAYSEAAAISAQLAFTCAKLGAEAASAVADLLLATKRYAEAGELIWRFVDKARPTVADFLMAYAAATWCLLGNPRSDRNPNERAQCLRSLPHELIPKGPPGMKLDWLSQIFGEPLLDASILDAHRTMRDTITNELEVMESIVDDFPSIEREEILHYGASAIELSRLCCNTLVEKTDEFFTTEFLVQSTRWALDVHVALQVPGDVRSYSRVEEWLTLGKGGASISGVRMGKADMVASAYLKGCLIDALFLGDAVNQLPVGSEYISAFLGKVNVMPVGI